MDILESVNFKKVRSIAKVVGTVITVSGALLMTLYKGPIVDFIKFGGGGGGGGSAGGSHGGAVSAALDKHWVLGTLMLLGRTFGWAGFFILQSFTLKEYPAELSLTALICLMGTLEGTAISLVTVRDLSAWKIGFDSNLFAAAYSGKGKDKRMMDDDEISKGLPVKSPVKVVDAGKVLAGESEMKTKEGQETNKATQAEI
ncbi:unnamed protein product [Eruca vesicaria subsp. sativa]|uniref:WAT1-related protein n=1 Tax=Eruca vesicaria subsp. sativa TaxID=29727 RepID=A0ABC8KK33_ERUVS|nr:unnamed protein product [Eruca vesicaria subsp. sativa]